MKSIPGVLEDVLYFTKTPDNLISLRKHATSMDDMNGVQIQKSGKNIFGIQISEGQKELLQITLKMQQEHR